MDKLNIQKVNGEILDANEFNSVVNKVNSLIDALEKIYTALNLQGVNIEFVTEDEWAALTASGEIDPNVVYITR
jgi:hypothetical protein